MQNQNFPINLAFAFSTMVFIQFGLVWILKQAGKSSYPQLDRQKLWNRINAQFFSLFAHLYSKQTEPIYSRYRVSNIRLFRDDLDALQYRNYRNQVVCNFSQEKGNYFLKTCDSLQVFTVCRAGTIPVIKPDQTISIITSILRYHTYNCNFPNIIRKVCVR